MISKQNTDIGSIYAVTGGDYLGEFFVLMEQKNDDYIFLSLPDFKIRQVPLKNHQFAIKNNILELQEKLPSDIFNECRTKYNQINAKTIIN